jgi:cardiolipin synthase
MRKHIPNSLTVLRLVLAVSGALALWLSFSWHGAGDAPAWLGDATLAARGLGSYGVFAFVLAAFSDWLDGWLARRWQVESPLGALLDPIADKLLVDAYLLVYLLILTSDGTGFSLLPDLAVPIGAIILRDLVITGMRFTGTPGDTIPVSLSAKLKTGIAMFVAGFPLLAFIAGWQDIGWVLPVWVAALWITAALSLWTGFSYLIRPRTP